MKQSHPLMKEFFRNNKLLFMVNLIFRISMGLTGIVIAYMFKQTIDIVFEGSLPKLYHMFVLCVSVIFARLFLYIAMRYTFSNFMRRGMSQYKSAVFRRILDKDVNAFYHENSSLYLSAMTNDAANIEANYISKIFLLITQFTTMSVALVLMFSQSVILTVIALGLSALPIIVSMKMGNRMAVEEKNVSDRNESFVATVTDLLSGFSLIKRFQIEPQAEKQFDESNNSLEYAKCNREKTSRTIMLLGEFTGEIAQFGVFLIGGYLVITGRGVSPGMITMFLQLMNYIIDPLSVVPPIIAARKSSKALIGKLEDALAYHRTDDAVLQMPESLKKGITMDHVRFAYQDGADVIRDLSTEFMPGACYAIVGTSGSGKSTVLHLLSGQSKEYKGGICYDDISLMDISTASLFEKVSLVQQNVFLFHDSIKNNITMYREVDEARLQQVINMSGLRTLVEEKGLEFDCGENGKNLSGGERQRISIARSLLFDYEILMFDEVTSALDKVTADQVMQSILSLDGITRLVVTHQLDEHILSRFDSILVMRDGTVCEQGGFEELMDKKGYFYALYMIEAEAA